MFKIRLVWLIVFYMMFSFTADIVYLGISLVPFVGTIIKMFRDIKEEC